LFVALLLACAAEAKGVSVSQFEGSGAAKVQKAITAKLCRRHFCGGGDGSGVNVLTGKVFVRGGKKLLELELHDSDGNLILSQRFPASGRGYAKKVNLAVRKALKQVEAEDEADDDDKDGDEEDFDMP